MLAKRVSSALVLVPIVIALAYLGGYWFAALVLGAALCGVFEYCQAMNKGGHNPSVAAALVLATFLVVDAYNPSLNLSRFAIALVIMLLMVRQVFQSTLRGFLTNWALTIAGALYVGVLGGYLVSIRNLSDGFGWLLYTFVITWATDMAAYAVGSRWGRHGFFVHVSPKKTWEGAIAGFMGGLLVTVVGGVILNVPVWQGLVLGVVMVLGVTFGDLAESLLKRQVGIKDSSTLIPGHGGILDRIDSLLFAGMIMYYFIVWIVIP